MGRSQGIAAEEAAEQRDVASGRGERAGGGPLGVRGGVLPGRDAGGRGEP